MVDWGDGESDHSAAHHYEQAGYYRVRVVGTAISQLDVSKCHLTELKLDKCPLLENLNCAYNRLITLELVCCPKLKLLNCSGNRLSVLRSRCNRELVYLDCSDNVLQSLELDACPDLLYLFCFSNRLHSLYLGGCDNLVCVDTGGNGFEAEALNQLLVLYLLLPKEEKPLSGSNSPMEVSGSAGWNFCTLKAGKWSELYSGCRSTGL